MFSGDDHLYERLEVDGIPYFVNGAGGAPLYGFSTPLPESRARFSYHGAMLVHVTDTEVTTGFYAIGGVLPLDSFPGPSSVVPPVHVLEIQVASSTAQQTGYAIPTGSGEQLTRVPVARPDQISLLFSGRAFTDEDDLVVRGMDHGLYTVARFEEREGAVAGTWQATWTLSQPLAADFVEVVLDAGVGDQFGRRIDGEWQNPRRASETSSDSLPTGDGLPGGEFRFRFTVLPGDATRDNRIDEADLAALAQNYGLRDDVATFAEGDFDGNGAVGLGDLVILRSNLREDRTAWNHLPRAMPDAYVADSDTLLSVPVPGVLLNDSDPDGDAMGAILTRGPEHGELVFNADGSFSYQPFPEYTGPDSFAYRAFDGIDYSGETVVSLSTRPNLSVLRVSVVEDENDGDFGPSDLSLREAIVLANSIEGHSTIHVPAGMYDLSLPAIAGDNGNDAAYGDLDLTDSVTIIGDGPDRTVINAESRYGVFESLWVGQSNVAIELRGLTVEGGNAEFGGGIHVYGPITITITDCLLRNNHASEYGGGLLFDGGAMVRLMNSTVTGNTAAGFGGGIFNGSGTSLTLINTTVSGNTAQNGGAIHLFELGNPSTLVIQSSTIAYNTATMGPDGGISTHEGLIQFAGQLILKNSILAQNSGHDFYGNFDPASEYNWIGVGDRIVGGPTDGQNGNRIGTLAAPLDPRLAPLAITADRRQPTRCCRTAP